MGFLTQFALCAVLAGSQFAVAAPPGSVAPGALATIQGKVSQWPLPVRDTPRDPAADAAGGIYFTVAKADRIVRFDPTTGQFRDWILPAGTTPTGVVVARDGRIYFAGNGNGSLGELDTTTGAVRRHPLPDPASRPYSLTLDAEGNVWITERAGRIARFTPAGALISEYPMDGSPYGLAFDRRGILWVTRIDANKLTAFNPKTGLATDVFMGAGSKPRRIAVAPDGMVWVSLYGSGLLAKVDPARNSVVKEYALPGGPNAGPYSVNVDARGRVWVAEYQTDSVAVLDPQTERFQVIRLPDKSSGVRNATIDARGRYWYIGTTSGQIGVIE